MLKATITIYDRNATIGQGNPVASTKHQFELTCNQRHQIHAEIQQAIDFLQKLRDGYLGEADDTPAIDMNELSAELVYIRSSARVTLAHDHHGPLHAVPVNVRGIINSAESLLERYFPDTIGNLRREESEIEHPGS